MTSTMSGATQDSLAHGTVSGAQLDPVAHEIASRIGAGLLPAPVSADGWADLVKQFTSQGQSYTSAGSATLSDINKPADTTSGTTAPKTTSTMPSGGGMGQGQSAFVQQMTPYAEYASQQTGLDPKLILAQWGNETAWGTSYQWTHNYNPAGIGITGPEVQGQGFGSVQGGVQAYIDFLKNNPRYQSVMGTKGADAQAVALGNSGWAAGKYDGGSGPGSALISSMGNLGTPADNGAALPVSTLGSVPAVDYARQQIGTAYVWGGEQQGLGFDCSGLVQAAYKNSGVNLPRTAQEQYNATTKVPSIQQAQPGDLVFYGQDAQHITHVGIYIGNGQMIDAPHSGAQVRTENLWGGEVGITRPSDHNGTTVAPAGSQQAQVHAQNTTAYYQALDQIKAAMSAVGAR